MIGTFSQTAHPPSWHVIGIASHQMFRLAARFPDKNFVARIATIA
jgi:hypothetical protein